MTANLQCGIKSLPTIIFGEEVSADAIDSKYFVGYEFKKNLLVVQQAIVIWCLSIYFR